MKTQFGHRSDYKVPRTPVYKKIEQDLRNRVQNAYWSPGSMLPGRKALAEQYGVGLPTLTRAIVSLLADGTLCADERRGTFVPDRPVAISPNASQQIIETAGGQQSATPFLSAGDRTRVFGIIEGEYIVFSEDSDALENDWANIIIRSMEQAFSKAGGVSLFLRRYDANQNIQIGIRDAISNLLAQGADALAIVNVNNLPELVKEVLRSKNLSRVPIVTVSWDVKPGPLTHVIYDNYSAGYNAARHLMQNGYGNLYFVAPTDKGWSEERLLGARVAVRDAERPASSLVVIRPEGGSAHSTDPELSNANFNYEEAGYSAGEMMRDMDRTIGTHLGDPDGPPGIIAANDATARGVMRAFSEQGKTAGKDYGIIGFDDAPFARNIGLSSLRPPLEEMGFETARLLTGALQTQMGSQEIRLQSHLFARASTLRTHAFQGSHEHTNAFADVFSSV